MTGQNRFAAPKPKADPFAAHRMQGYRCLRCGETQGEIEARKLPCISEARASGNAAIRRITR